MKFKIPFITVSLMLYSSITLASTTYYCPDLKDIHEVDGFMGKTWQAKTDYNGIKNNWGFHFFKTQTKDKQIPTSFYGAFLDCYQGNCKIRCLYNTNNINDDNHVMTFGSYNISNKNDITAPYGENKQIADHGCRSSDYKECPFEIKTNN